MKKKRKKRTKSQEMCDLCCNVGCSPMWPNTPAYLKMRKRRELGLCIACGKMPCECKSERK